MLRTIVPSALATTLLLTTFAAAAAEDTGTSEGPSTVAPVRTWELTVGQGYNQGFGEVRKGAPKLEDLARGGPSLQLGFGYRLNPQLFLGVYAEGARYLESSEVPDHTEIYSTAFGVQANWHFMPFSRVDPWVALGTGFRAYWVDREAVPTEAFYGFDLARVRVGADYQLGPSTRIGPMVGATVATFTSHQSPTQTEPHRIDDPKLSTFVFAGFQGRFEIGGQRVTEKQARTARR